VHEQQVGHSRVSIWATQRYRTHTSPTLTGHRTCFYGKEEGAVKARWLEAKNLRASGQPVPENCTVGEWLDRWLRDHARLECDPKSYASYAQMVRIHIRPQLGRYKLRDLRPQVIKAWLDKKAETKCATSDANLSDRTRQYMHNFATGKGTAYEHRRYVTWFKSMLKAAGLATETRVYDLRHTSATYLPEEGESAWQIADVLGHSTIQFTMDTYRHPLKKGKARTAATADGMLVRKAS